MEFVVEKKKVLSLMIGPPKLDAKLIANIRVLRAILVPVEPVPCAAKCVPASKFVSIAVEGVGAALGYHVDDRAGVAAVLGVEVIGDNPKFLRWNPGSCVQRRN